MNPIPLNDRGQFRYTDFVAYLPEFLVEEPDVVDFLQLMSDYINDAYRNIEDVEEFEFKLCVAEPKVARAMEVLARLRTMFTLASGRSDRVYYLSVPRANVKSNVVFGKNTGHTPYYIDLSYDEIYDEINGISGIDRKVASMDDGDVVFVRYVKMDPVITKAYYYCREKNSLIADDEGTTQDPFTDTDNLATRMISFLVDDISSIGKRYGGENSGNTYYEIFFTARISDVKNEPATEQVRYDADRVDGVADDILVDYYGMSYVPNGKYHTSLSFYSEDGWEWKDGYPTGMFYLKDTTGAKLSAVGDAMGKNEELAVDPTIALKSDKYALTSDAVFDILTGTWEFRTSAPLPQASGTRFYVSDKNTGECKGEFVASPSYFIDEVYVTRMSAVWTEFSDTIPASDNCVLNFPLFYTKGMPDFRTSTPLIHWKDSPEMGHIDWTTATIERCGADTETAGTVFYFDDRRKPAKDGAYTFYAPGNIYGTILPGMDIYCGNTIWDGIHTVKSVVPEYDGQVSVRMDVPLNWSYCGNVQLMYGMTGIMKVTGPGKGQWNPYSGGDYSDGSLDKVASAVCSDELSGDVTGYLECHAPDGSTYNARVTSVNRLTGEIEFVSGDIPYDADAKEITYACTVANVYPTRESVGATGNKWGRARKITGVTRGTDGNWSGKCTKYAGDVFTDGLFYVYDSKGNSAFMELIQGEMKVIEFVPNRRYSVGETVYCSEDGNIYRCTSACVPQDGDLPGNMEYFKLDKVSKFRTEYTEIYNKFMPYYGQVKALDYGGTVNYLGDMSIVTRPLYITKVVENRLKYGWEHREFLNYGTMMNMNNRDRNGSVDIFSSARSGGDSCIETRIDAVTATLDSKAIWNITYPLAKRGTEAYIPLDVDNPVSIPVEYVGDHWTVTVASAGHGMVEGALIRVAGFGKEHGVDINGYFRLHVIDGDNFSFDVPVEKGISVMTMTYVTVSEGSSIRYIGQYWMDTVEVSAVGEDYRIKTASPAIGIRPGDTLELCDLDVDTGKADGLPAFSVTVLDEGDLDDTALRVTCGDNTLMSQLGHHFHIRRDPAVGDYVLADDEVYHVSEGVWEHAEKSDLAIPSVLLSRKNLIDTSATNPEWAIGEDIRIDSIIPDGMDSAIVRLKDMLPHFTVDNAEVINGRTMVRIANVTPSQYNGWHTVTDVISPKAFKVTMRFAKESDPVPGMGVNGEEMYLNEGRWYAFTVKGLDWNKVSNRVTYSLNNGITDGVGDEIITEREHGLHDGDYVVVGSLENLITVDRDNLDTLSSKIGCYRVRAVTGGRAARLVTLDGDRVVADSLVGCVVSRGVVLTDRLDDLGSLRNEYTRNLHSLGGKNVRFRNGDIVVALAQQNPCEIMSWRVVANGYWVPVRSKRSMKVSSLGVYSYLNGKYDETDVNSGEAREKYETYSDVDIATFDADVYMAGYRCVANQQFYLPSIDEMDTTRRADEEYSSREDYSTVAPRHNMKAGFKGIPSMKYPLAEKIERLCYLRDARVIDYDMIEYLARFLGYDITSLGDDVTESSLYRNKHDRELAVRETIANLPQYYALGGTRSGLHMLMSTFGVIADVLTLWTDANHPYKELIPKKEVEARYEDGDKGKWVPTPYIDIEVTSNADLPQFSVMQSDIERLREQIRVFKPINVVFRDFLYRVVDTVYLKPTITLGGISGSTGLGAMVNAGDADDIKVEYGDPSAKTCKF